MRRIITFILCVMGIGTAAQAVVPYSRQVECGSWFELSCTPYEDYHFVQWSDGDTNAIRQVEIKDDVQYIAYIAPNCEEYADLPVLALYDWLIMLDVRAVHNMGYTFAKNNVTWYRVVGEPDKLSDDYFRDDQIVAYGYYLTIDQNFKNTGDYYAVIDMSNSNNMPCMGLMRTVIVHYASTNPKQHLALLPTNVYSGQQMRIMGLNPEEESTILVYDMVGKLIETHNTQAASTFFLKAVHTAGCYNVVVQTAKETTTLRYLVHTK